MKENRHRLDLAFAGTGLRGWQAQSRGTTVQGLVDGALRAVGHRGPRAVGCSRTDAGVHARLFTAHVDLSLERPLPALLKGLNANLPPEVRVYRVSRVPEDFHARYACLEKTYRYHLHRGPVVPPFLAPYVWCWQGPLDTGAMEEAAALFLGEHDFAALTTADGRERNTRRTVTRCRLEARGDLLVLEVAGPSFLHRMVRCMAGLLVAVGTGRLTGADVAGVLKRGRADFQIPALPAQGLVLWEARYGSEMAGSPSAGEIPARGLFPLGDR